MFTSSSLNCHHGIRGNVVEDGNENVIKGVITTTLHVNHSFWHVLSSSQQDYDLNTSFMEEVSTCYVRTWFTSNSASV